MSGGRLQAAVVDYDLGNLPSVTKMLERIGVEPKVVDSGNDLDDLRADALVLPGVGHFGTGMRNLRSRGLDASIRDWADEGKALLGICVGLQLFMESSEEDPDEKGLSILPGGCRRLSAEKVPHMGWNTLDVTPRSQVLRDLRPDDMAYFVHSFYVEPDGDVVAATTTYGDTFCSAVESENVFGVQFHPEKSAEVGRRVLEGFFAPLR